MSADIQLAPATARAATNTRSAAPGLQKDKVYNPFTITYGDMWAENNNINKSKHVLKS